MSAVSHTWVAASYHPLHGHFPLPEELLDAACALRERWLRRGLCTDPSDRSTAQAAVAELYRLIGEPEPEFLWVPSPPAAVTATAEHGLRCEVWQPGADLSHLPMAGRLATLFSAARHRMDRRIEGSGSSYVRKVVYPRPVRTVGAQLRRIVYDPLRATLVDGVVVTTRTLMPGIATASMGIPWYGQQEAYRFGFYDILREIAATRYRAEENHLLDVLTTLADTTGWWWSYDRVCVMVERPRLLHTEPTPQGAFGERRLHHDESPALEFADGAAVHVLHGAIVPGWVVTDPTPERIGREPNVEVRRCAIERLGWDVYLDRAGLCLLGEAEDPGNPGQPLRCYRAPDGWGFAHGNLLVAVNGSVERDGTRRRYVLAVPRDMTDPVRAAAWTYGLEAADYSRLVRRT